MRFARTQEIMCSERRCGCERERASAREQEEAGAGGELSRVLRDVNRRWRGADVRRAKTRGGAIG